MDRRAVIGGSLAAALGSLLPFEAGAAPRSGGWRPLFDGSSLDGWTFYQEGVGNIDTAGAVSIDNGVLHFLGPRYRSSDAPPGHISTVAEWENYHLRLQYRYGVSRWPPRTERYEPSSGAPTRARSPMASSILWRTNSWG